MTKLGGGGIPTSVKYYYSLRLCRLFLYTRTLTPLLLKSPTSPPHEVLRPLGCRPSPSQHLQLLHKVILPHGSFPYPYQHPNLLLCLPAVASYYYCVSLSPCLLIFASRDISSKVDISGIRPPLTPPCFPPAPPPHRPSLLRTPRKSAALPPTVPPSL